MEFIDLFNAVARHCKAVREEYQPATSYDDPINEDTLNLDSLDITLTFVMLTDIFEVPAELEDQWPVESIGALRDFIEANKQADPTGDFATPAEVVEEYR